MLSPEFKHYQNEYLKKAKLHREYSMHTTPRFKKYKQTEYIVNIPITMIQRKVLDNDMLFLNLRGEWLCYREHGGKWAKQNKTAANFKNKARLRMIEVLKVNDVPIDLINLTHLL